MGGTMAVVLVGCTGEVRCAGEGEMGTRNPRPCFGEGNEVSDGKCTSEPQLGPIGSTRAWCLHRRSVVAIDAGFGVAFDERVVAAAVGVTRTFVG
ncbi:hypothetical protein L6452_01436 [Arctium lappa]|uniref:Uncharacterized protein n=1 Tax=Arctium lappa TaxID=4217 RepID=A0ACB9FHA5_ARCLA|nr:hypothetical protein L6452_01436 [Arctium lappa]